MPANFDLFSTAVMLKAIEQTPRVFTFLSDTFAADGGLCEDERAIYDYRKGAESGLAPFVVPNAGGVTINRDPYEMRQIQFSTVAPQRVLQLEDVSSRMFGEAVTGAMTPEQRSKRVLARDLMELKTMVQNRRNWMVREVLLKGKLAIQRYTNAGIEKEASMLADFGFTNFYTPVNPWDAAGAVTGLLDVALIRSRAAALGIREIDQRVGSLLFYTAHPDRAALLALTRALPGRVLMNAGARPYLTIKLQKGQDPTDGIREVLTVLEAAAAASAQN